MAPGTRSKTNPKSAMVRASTNETSQSNLIPNSMTLTATLTSQASSDTLSQNPATNSTITAPTNTESASVKKRGRGKARGFQLKKRMKEGNKIDGVIIDKDKYPVGPSEKIFKMELGIITRLIAPLRVFYWSHMTEDKKLPLFAKLESEFEINVDDPHVREVVDSIMATRFKQYKHICHKHYEKFTIEDARKNPPEDVTEEDWVHLCTHFESEAFKKRSEANKNNRAQSQVPNRTGSKSYAQRIYEMRNSEVDCDEPHELKLYFDMHHNKEGAWDHPKSQENYEKMIAEFEKSKEEEVPLTGKQIVDKILKPKSRARPTARRVARDYYQECFQSEKQAREQLEETVQTQNEQIKSQADEIAKLHASHAELKALIMSSLNRNGGQTSPSASED